MDVQLLIDPMPHVLAWGATSERSDKPNRRDVYVAARAVTYPEL